MAEALVILEGENIVSKLASSFPESEQKEIARDMFLAMNMKGVTVKNDEGKNVKQKFDAFQALSYVMACRDLGLNPVLNHVIMLEDQFYITLQGHLQNAHKTGQLIGLKTELVSDKEAKVRKWDWKSKSFIESNVKQFRYKCIVAKRTDGNGVAEFYAEGVADETNVTGGDKATELKIEQMAEARAMRRTLARAFPVGLSNYEDVLEAEEIGLRMTEASAEVKAEAGKLMAAKKPKAAAMPDPVPEPAKAPEPVKEPEPEVAEPSEPQKEQPKEEAIVPAVTDVETAAAAAEAATEISDDVKAATGVAEVQKTQAEEVAEVFGDEPKEPTLSELEDQVMIARVEFTRALNAHKANPNPDTEVGKNAAAAEVVRLNRLIAAKNGG